MRKTSLCLALAGILAQPVAAQPRDFMLDDVVVIATREPESLAELAADVSVLERHDIERAGQATLSELLQALPGVEISQNGGAGAAAGVFLRGGNSGHTLILLDGVPMTSATLGSARLEHIPLDMVERIEILRGPASHLYGSEALGGVVQIFTRRGQGVPRLTAAAGLGSLGRRQASVGYGGERGDWRYHLAAGEERQDGFNARPAFYADRDGYRNRHAALNLEYRLSAAHRLSAHGLLSDARNHYDDGVTAYDSHADTRQSAAGLALDSRLGEEWQGRLRLDHGGEDVRTRGYNDPFLPWFAGGPYASRIRMDQWTLGGQLDGYTALGDVQLLLERMEQAVGGDVAYTLTDRARDSLMLAWRRRLGAHGLDLSLRRDVDSQFGGQNTGALTYSWRPAAGWLAAAGWGSAFKAPAFDDLYWPGAGNPTLRPEEGRNLEASLKYAVAGRDLSLTAYRNKVHNLIQWADSGIDFDGDGWTDWRPANVAHARLQGLTLAWREQRGPYTLRASVDLQDPRNTDLDTRLIRRARQHGGLGLDWAGGPWRLSADLLAQGRRYDDAANTLALPGYALLNLGAAYQWHKAWRLEGRLANLLDRDYVLAQGYATPGRNLFVALRYTGE